MAHPLTRMERFRGETPRGPAEGTVVGVGLGLLG
jgi:hypothetical protein